MKIAEILNERKDSHTLQDFQKVPYDTPYHEKNHKDWHEKNPYRGPQEGKNLNLMLRGMKPISMIKGSEKDIFKPYIKDGTFVIAGKYKDELLITLPGQEWRASRLISLFSSLTGEKTKEQMAIHAKIGILLGLPKEAIRYFITH